MKKGQENTCVSCGKSINFSKENEALWPFCSKRCKMIDLGKWLGEKYVVNEQIPSGMEEKPSRAKGGEEDE